ncbi:MAG: ABC transporter ATP-binding protein [Actinomycetia bacterium]|nr:ABC transporter ATP-binding protein [Actinomycetes bacterium]
MLRLEGVSKRFGGLWAVNNLTCEIARDVITCLVGPNGAGKTTVFNLITGFLQPDGGRIWYGERRIDGQPPPVVARLGIGRTFQDLKLFGNMTVLEHLLLAQERGLLSWRRYRTLKAEAERILERFELLEKAHWLASDISYAEQKFLSLARLVALGPRALLLDEPASGLDGPSLDKLVYFIRSLQGEGRSVLVIEHNLDIVRQLADHILFLDNGQLVAEGSPEKIFGDDRLADLYFGRVRGA